MAKQTKPKQEPEIEAAGSGTSDQAKPKAFNHYRDRIIPEQQARIEELEVKLTELETANSRLTAEKEELTQKVNSQVNPEVNQELTAELTEKNEELTAKLTKVNSELTALKLEVNQAGEKLTQKDLELDAADKRVNLLRETFGPRNWELLHQCIGVFNKERNTEAKPEQYLMALFEHYQVLQNNYTLHDPLSRSTIRETIKKYINGSQG